MKKQHTIILSIILLMFTVSCTSLSQYQQVQNESFSGLFTRVNKYIITNGKNREYYYSDYKEFTDSDTVIELKNNTEKKIGILRNLQFETILPKELVRFSVDDEVVIIGCSGVYSVYEFDYTNGRKRYLIVEVQSVNFTEKMYFEYGNCHLDKTGKFVDEETYSNYMNELPYGYKSLIATVNLWRYRDELQDWLEELGTTVVFNRCISPSDMQQYGGYEEEKNEIMEYYGISEDDFKYIAGDIFGIQYIRNEERNWDPIVIDDNQEASQIRLKNIIENEKVAEEQRIQQLKLDAYKDVISSMTGVLSNAFEEHSNNISGEYYKIQDDGKIEQITTSNSEELNSYDSIAYLKPLYATDNPYNYDENVVYVTEMKDEVTQWLSRTSYLGKTYEDVSAEDIAGVFLAGLYGFDLSNSVGREISGYFTIDDKQKALNSPFYMYKGTYEYTTTSGAYKIVPHFQKIVNDDNGRKVITDYSKKQLDTSNNPIGKDLFNLIMKGSDISFEFPYSKDDWRSLVKIDDFIKINFPVTIHCTDGDVWYNGGTEVF